MAVSGRFQNKVRNYGESHASFCYYFHLRSLKQEASVNSALFSITSSIVKYYLLALKVVIFWKYIFVRCSLIFKISFEYFIGTHDV